jgi:hypothetical protein
MTRDEKFLLQQRTVTMTSPLLSGEAARGVVAAMEAPARCLRDDAARLVAEVMSKMGVDTTRLNDAGKVEAVKFCDRLSGHTLVMARLIADFVAASKVGMPSQKDFDRYLKMADERRLVLMALAKAHIAEGERREAAAAEDRRIEEDRAKMTPEQRAEFVQQRLKQAGMR